MAHRSFLPVVRPVVGSAYLVARLVGKLQLYGVRIEAFFVQGAAGQAAEAVQGG